MYRIEITTLEQWYELIARIELPYVCGHDHTLLWNTFDLRFLYLFSLSILPFSSQYTSILPLEFDLNITLNLVIRIHIGDQARKFKKSKSTSCTFLNNIKSLEKHDLWEMTLNCHIFLFPSWSTFKRLYVTDKVCYFSKQIL